MSKLFPRQKTNKFLLWYVGEVCERLVSSDKRNDCVIILILNLANYRLTGVLMIIVTS